ncbi:glycosyl-phosphatidylinositol-anchored molecule-like protein [Orycteropus afer afer]|uniref:Glycosyl-phosphatidylinositol-anchored molecule-like protein n=1 Tax=Orycteropus afer afer TaxID=1230840 RepID=A0A8B6ZUC9_ORYAF|nr:glycosyl-phosphatidylinositol-anchored molecule-like protein [Orycteropus afer afer]
MMLSLILLLAVGLPLEATNLTQPLSETDPTRPLAETNPTRPLAETDLTRPLAETEPTQPLTETGLTRPLTETSPTRPLVETDPIQPLAETNLTDSPRWTFNLICYNCAMLNTFSCTNMLTCEYDIRRCMTISIRLNARELLVYKNCTFNCTFVYPAEVPPETPRRITRSTNFYYVRCCSGMRCNEGGPTNTERDMLPIQPVEEELPEGAARLGEPALPLSLASLLLSSTLT